ncbi:MAG: carboxypeptidase-like regulatory domain-containing protein [Clostridiales bacterium]|nr:carboxypeptidase-like regulatory domain-containing protein [Clostridiales bacterium]
MKKFLSLLLALMTLALPVLAEAPAVNVYVSVTDDTGALALAYQSVAVTDADADGVLTINDALTCAHAAHHELGADAYAASATDYGMSMNRLWNVENGGSYGYYLNDLSAWSLLDPVVEGDHVKAYCFTDLAAWSDTYAFFHAPALNAGAGEAITLTLSAAAFDASFAPITIPVAGATITVNGESANVVTDAEGKTTITLAECGVYTISASTDAMTMVAPVCVITVE